MTDLSGYTIVFDLDGTLVETAGDIRRALNVVLESEGLPTASVADVRTQVGLGANALIARAFAARGVNPPTDRLEQLTEAYTAEYARDIASLSHPFPGVLDALDSLRGMGATLSVCTNKRTYLSVQLLDSLNMQHHFAAIVGSSDVTHRKPHPEHYLRAIRAAGGDPSRSAMVGDSINDVMAAKGAGAPVAVYAFGYTDTAPDQLGADAVFTHFTELPDLLVRLLAA